MNKKFKGIAILISISIISINFPINQNNISIEESNIIEMTINITEKILEDSISD